MLKRTLFRTVQAVGAWIVGVPKPNMVIVSYVSVALFFLWRGGKAGAGKVQKQHPALRDVAKQS